MRVESLSLPLKISSNPGAKVENKPDSPTFKEMLFKALKEIEQMQVTADQLNEKLVTGQLENIHEAVIAMEKASITLQMALLFRNKVIEAYQEIMRINL